MTVTDIKQQKKDKSRYSVYIDGEYAFSLIMEDILYFGLKIGEDISDSVYDYITETTLYIKAQDSALKYLGYRMRDGKGNRGQADFRGLWRGSVSKSNGFPEKI